MRASLDIPDEIYRRIEAKSAQEGRALQDVTIELYERWIGASSPSVDRPEATAWIDEFLSHTIPADLPGPTAREILDEERNRFDPPRPA